MLGVAIVSLAALRVAWVSDDALITLRSALNITHNWGPGYNATEAVQAYTHPLWYLLWVWVGAWTNQWILGILALGLILVAVAVALLMWQTGSVPRVIVITAALLLSNAFMDFTSSGLENPLAYAAVALLIVLTLRSDLTTQRLTWVWAAALGATAAAVFLTRMDLLVLIAPALIAIAWSLRVQWRLLAASAVAFVLPLAIWFTWTWLTYAALLPNTFAAKTNAQIPRSEFIIQGLRYLWVSFENDPITLLVLLAGIGVGFAFGPRMLRMWALGALAYLAYIVWVGGDFMGGRFLAVPFLVTAFLLACSSLANTDATKETRPEVKLAGAGALIAVMLIGVTVTGTQSTALANPQAPRWEVDQNFNAGVDDARGSSVADGDSLKGLVDTLSLAFVDPDFVPIGDGTGLGRALRNLDKSAGNWPKNDGTFSNPSEVGVFCGYLGNIGIATGPTTHLIDGCALTDRFLAERPFVPAEPFAWKPGHFHRAIPEGYEEAVSTGDPLRLRDTADAFALRELWNKIR